MARKFHKDYIGDNYKQLPPVCLSNATHDEFSQESPKPRSCMDNISKMHEPPGFSTDNHIARVYPLINKSSTMFTNKPIHPKFRGRFVDNNSPTKVHNVLDCGEASDFDVDKCGESSRGGQGAPLATPYYTKQQRPTFIDRRNKSWHVQNSFGCARLGVPPQAAHQHVGFVDEEDGNDMPQNNGAFRFLQTSNTSYQHIDFDIEPPPMPRLHLRPQLQRCPHPNNFPNGRPLLQYNTNSFQRGSMLWHPQPHLGFSQRSMVLGQRPIPMQQMCAPVTYNVPMVTNQLHVSGSVRPNNVHQGGPPNSFASNGVYPPLGQQPSMHQRPPQVISNRPCVPMTYNYPNPLIEGMSIPNRLRPTNTCDLRPLGPRAPFNYVDTPHSPYSPLTSSMRPHYQSQEGYDYVSQGFAFKSPINNEARMIDKQPNELTSLRVSHNPNNNSQMKPPDLDTCNKGVESHSRLIAKYGADSRVAMESTKRSMCVELHHANDFDANIVTDSKTHEFDVEARDDIDCQVGGKGDTHSVGSSEEKEEKAESTKHTWESPKDSSFRHFVRSLPSFDSN